MTLKELQSQLLALTPEEKAQAIQIMTYSFNQSRGITKTPNICGGNACIENTRIPVWSLVKYQNLGANDDKILEAFPHLTAADLVNAWTYSMAYPDEIKQAIRENDEVMQEDRTN
jgi:uncharacterized protein (DUF433 family)